MPPGLIFALRMTICLVPYSHGKQSEGALKWIELLHIKTDLVQLQITLFLNSANMSKKETYKSGSASLLFSFSAHNHLKSLSAALTATKTTLSVLQKTKTAGL